MIDGLNIRLGKNGLETVAGASFRDLRENGCPHLSMQTEKKGLIGIENANGGNFTIIGLEHLYIKIDHSEVLKVDLKVALSALSSNALENGKLKEFEFVPLENGQRFWVKDKKTMSALWNTALFISRLGKNI